MRMRFQEPVDNETFRDNISELTEELNFHNKLNLLKIAYEEKIISKESYVNIVLIHINNRIGNIFKVEESEV